MSGWTFFSGFLDSTRAIPVLQRYSWSGSPRLVPESNVVKAPFVFILWNGIEVCPPSFYSAIPLSGRPYRIAPPSGAGPSPDPFSLFAQPSTWASVVFRIAHGRLFFLCLNVAPCFLRVRTPPFISMNSRCLFSSFYRPPMQDGPSFSHFFFLPRRRFFFCRLSRTSRFDPALGSPAAALVGWCFSSLTFGR